MKKVIEGILYNTDTSKCIGKHTYAAGGDFDWIDESLYLSRKGKFFIAGKGGANTGYSRSIGANSWSGGENSIPMTREEALDWAEYYMGADDIEKYFGKMPEA
jgi:hypothetical protein